MRKATVSLALIVKNERKASEVIFPQIPKEAVDEIFVIDGHSTDGTMEYFRRKGVKVFEQNIEGLGGAVIEARKRTKTDGFILFHPDGNEDPKDIRKCANLLRLGHEFVIPSRMIKGGYNEEDNRLLRPRKWFNKTIAFLVNLLFNSRNRAVTETVQGFRAIRCDTFDKLKLDAFDSTIDFQMVLRALKHKVNIYEFPTIERKRLFGSTNFDSFQTGLAILSRFVKELFIPSSYPS